MPDRLFPLGRITAEMPHIPPKSFVSWWRYAVHGFRGVKLESRYVGSTLCTTSEWVERFIADCTQARTGKPVTTRRTSKRRERAVRRSAARCDAMGA